ncbi:hypothetical protein NUW54_g5853 [Trametes sanguinea]|uniref:Uncharacterized protein n=1 Tax=Trametes sanguinea TaxID=158606 RepID=A0ACC1PUY2_9APHY|nr:hypothetical protein NUW54_g5853 [Trametes sanguinea]
MGLETNIDEFWHEVESSSSDVDEYEVDTVLRGPSNTVNSIQDPGKRTLQAMAVIVEVSATKLSETPAGRDGRYTAAQKAKAVPREPPQREFLRRFVSHTPEPEPRRSKASSRVKTEPQTSPIHSQAGNKKAQPRKADFEREPSQIPDGGWFKATIDAAGGGNKGPPSHSSPSSSSSSESTTTSSDSSDGTSETSSEDSNPSDSDGDSYSTGVSARRSRKTRTQKRHRVRQKKDKRRMKRALSGVKIKTPFAWDGTPDLDLFDQWTYEVDTWGELNELPDRIMIKLMIQFMRGEASRFFMRHVSTRQADWTVKRLYGALFDYCFPSDYKTRLRTRLERSAQGLQIFWKGLNTHLRVYLIEKGLNPEKTKLDKLVKYAVRKEEAYTEARREEKLFNGHVPGRAWGRFGNRAEAPEPYQPSRMKRESASTKDSPRPERMRQADPKRSRPQASRANQRTTTHAGRLPPEEHDRLRAEGRCFNCKETGHQSNNCPARRTARAPTAAGNTVHVGAVNFVRLEELSRQAEQTEHDQLFVGAMSLDTGPSPNAAVMSDGIMDQQEGEWSRCHTDDCIEYIHTLFQSYYGSELAISVGMDPMDRFKVTVKDDGRFLVLNRLAAIGLPDEYLVARQQLDDPNWGVSDIIQEEWDAWITIPPRPEWGTGFPPCDAPPGSHPALYWLRAHVKAALLHGYSEIPDRNGLVSVTEHNLGYRVTSRVNSEEDIYTHDDVSNPTFDPTAITKVILEGNPRQAKKKKPDLPASCLPALERNAMHPKDYTRKAPMPVVVNVQINGHSARALLDTGCMADFISTTLVDQLKITTEVLAKQLPVQLAVQGSRSKINRTCAVEFSYQDISSKRRFDVANLENYDIILGTPFIFQHKVALGLNPA